MKHLSVVLILSVLVSCGGGNNSKSPKQGEEQNGRNCLESRNMPCMPSTLWVIDPGSRKVPNHIQLEINDNTIFDSCRGEGYLVSPEVDGRMVMSMKIHGAIKENQTVVFKIIDKGEDCKDEKVFYVDRALKLQPSPYYEESDFFVSQTISIRLKD